MLKLFALASFLIALSSSSSRAADTSAPPSISLSAPWRAAIYDLCRTRLEHPAWGLAHCERDYLLATRIAREEHLEIDEEALFAAAFLHDAGAFEPYRAGDMDHTERGAQIAGELLAKAGFPMEKAPKVEAAIRGHMYYSKKPETPEAIALHDADTLDFMGAIGAARILSVTTRHRWAPDIEGALETISKFRKELPEKLVTETAKKIAKERAEEMKRFVDEVTAESAARRKD